MQFTSVDRCSDRHRCIPSDERLVFDHLIRIQHPGRDGASVYPLALMQLRAPITTEWGDVRNETVKQTLRQYRGIAIGGPALDIFGTLYT